MKIKLLFILAASLGISTITLGQFTLLTLEGEKQGKFNGESTRPGASAKIEVVGYQFEIKNPRDVATGRSVGKRQYQPLTIWKVAGASSPQFVGALTRNEAIKNLTLEFYKPDDVFKTTEQLFYKIELVNVSIASYKQVMGLPQEQSFKGAPANLYDEIRFVFEKITITHVKGNTTTTDEWNSGL